jgi:iron(III) transport system substrate-binding protein
MADNSDKFAKIFVVLALVATLAVPFLLRPERQEGGRVDERLVVVTPHNEAIRAEFARAFRDWHFERTGRVADIDWRTIGGTSEIVRYINSEFLNSFQAHWTRELGRPWSAVVQGGFNNYNVRPGPDPAADTEAEAARRAFLASNVSSGIDVFFGGGSFDFIRQANAGHLARSTLTERRPEWFTDEIIPKSHSGEPYRDDDGRWFGAVLSSFGIIYNFDSLQRLGIEEAPAAWRDLMDPRYRGELALADPTKSASMAKAFEMVLQQEIRDRFDALLAEGISASEAEPRAISEGWLEGFRVLQILGANARYFSDSSQKVPIDVSQGDMSAGMGIDFYSRAQAEVVVRRGAEPRVGYITPLGGSVYSVDPIGILRGARNPELAEAFLEFVLSETGQRLWNQRPGTPGGPLQHSLRRLPVRRDLYREELRGFRADPDVLPYSGENDFEYRAEWTSRLFRELAFIVRLTALDTHPELDAAWRAIIEAGMPAEALAILQDLSAVSYEEASGRIGRAIRSPNRLEEIQLAKELAQRFRDQYRRAEQAARAAQREG